MSRAEKISSWLKERAELAGAQGFVFGLSGGIDSAVVARLCQLATPGHVLGALMPCYSQPQDEHDAMLVAEAFTLPTVRIDLSRTFDTLAATLDEALKDLHPRLAVNVVDIKQRLPRANIKPRLRMTSLYYVANAMNYIVAGTGNRSEIELGYYTKYGDGGVDVLPIGGLLKSEVRVLAKELGVPEPIITKPPTAGLWPGQTDEAEMGFSYEMLEQYLLHGAATVPHDVSRRIELLREVSHHKRALPPVAPIV